MKRLLLNLLTALSLLLFLATAGLWMRSYFISDAFRKSFDPTHIYEAEFYRGRLILKQNRDEFSPPLFYELTRSSDRVEPEHGFRGNGDSLTSVMWRKSGWLGVAFGAEDYFDGISYYAVLPLWAMTLLLATPPVWHLLTIFRRTRRRLGLCPTCRYDLRAHLPHSELRTQNSELGLRCPNAALPSLPAKKEIP